MKKKVATAISIGDVARALKVGAWFNKYEFAKITGVSEKSSAARLHAIEKNGYLESMPSGSRYKLYSMSTQQKEAMILREKSNLKKWGRSFGRDVVGTDTEIEAKQAEGYKFLQSINFI